MFDAAGRARGYVLYDYIAQLVHKYANPEAAHLMFAALLHVPLADAVWARVPERPDRPLGDFLRGLVALGPRAPAWILVTEPPALWVETYPRGGGRAVAAADDPWALIPA